MSTVVLCVSQMGEYLIEAIKKVGELELPGQTKKSLIDKCMQIYTIFVNCIAETTQVCEKLEEELKQMIKQLADKTTQEVQLQAILVNHQKELEKHSVREAELKSNLQSAKDQLRNREAAYQHALEIQREDQRKRDNAVIDLIPGVAFFAGLFSGDFLRMIPFKSQIDGIVTAIQNDKDDLQRDVNNTGAEVSKTERTIWEVNSKMQNLLIEIKSNRDHLSKLEIERREIEKKIQALGRSLTKVQNISEATKELQASCKLTSCKVSKVENFIEGDGWFFSSKYKIKQLILRQLISGISKVQIQLPLALSSSEAIV